MPTANPSLFPGTPETTANAAVEPAPVANAAPVRATYPCVSCGRFVYPSAGTVCWWCRRNGDGEDEDAEATRDDRNTHPTRAEEALTDA